MKALLTFAIALAAQFSFAGSSSTSYLCYSGCTFDGYRAAERACETAAQGMNASSNRAVQITATCYQDRGQICGRRSPFCQFNDVVLEQIVTVTPR